jgi:hypothetical protein
VRWSRSLSQVKSPNHRANCNQHRAKSVGVRTVVDEGLLGAGRGRGGYGPAAAKVGGPGKAMAAGCVLTNAIYQNLSALCVCERRTGHVAAENERENVRRAGIEGGRRRKRHCGEWSTESLRCGNVPRRSSRVCDTAALPMASVNTNVRKDPKVVMAKPFFLQVFERRFPVFRRAGDRSSLN